MHFSFKITPFSSRKMSRNKTYGSDDTRKRIYTAIIEGGRKGEESTIFESSSSSSSDESDYNYYFSPSTLKRSYTIEKLMNFETSSLSSSDDESDEESDDFTSSYCSSSELESDDDDDDDPSSSSYSFKSAVQDVNSVSDLINLLENHYKFGKENDLKLHIDKIDRLYLLIPNQKEVLSISSLTSYFLAGRMNKDYYFTFNKINNLTNGCIFVTKNILMFILRVCKYLKQKLDKNNECDKKILESLYNLLKSDNMTPPLCDTFENFCKFHIK